MVRGIQAPVRLAWAVESGCPLPASHRHECSRLLLLLAKAGLQLLIHWNLTTPGPDPGLACLLPRAQSRQAALQIGVPWHIRTPVASCVGEEEASPAPVLPVPPPPAPRHTS